MRGKKKTSQDSPCFVFGLSWPFSLIGSVGSINAKCTFFLKCSELAESRGPTLLVCLSFLEIKGPVSRIFLFFFNHGMFSERIFFFFYCNIKPNESRSLTFTRALFSLHVWKQDGPQQGAAMFYFLQPPRVKHRLQMPDPNTRSCSDGLQG